MGEFDNVGDFYNPPNKPRPAGRKSGVMEYLPSALLTIVLIVVSGLGTLIQFNLQFHAIVFSTFIISLSLRLVTVFSAKYVGSNIYYNKESSSDKFLNVQKELIETGKNIDKAEFDRYVKERNVQLKKDAYKGKKRGKIALLKEQINKLTFANEYAYSERRTNRIKKKEKKIEELRAISTDEYVDANIIYIKVKYRKIRSSCFFSPYEQNAPKYRQYSVNVSREISKEIAKSLPLTILLVSLGSLIVFSATTGSINILSLFYDIAVILFNFIMGWFVVGKKAVASTVNAFINRIIFIKEFNNVKVQNANIENVEVATEESPK